eukprot:jgi/Chlat1/3222/Chrsp22S03503
MDHRRSCHVALAAAAVMPLGVVSFLPSVASQGPLLLPTLVPETRSAPAVRRSFTEHHAALVQALRSKVQEVQHSALRAITSAASRAGLLHPSPPTVVAGLDGSASARFGIVRSAAGASPLQLAPFAAIIPGGPDNIATAVVASGTLNFLNIYSSLLVARLILTWFPNPPEFIVSPLSTLCDPYLRLFRGIVPPLGNLDLSPIAAFFVLNVFTNAAAALPAEMPSEDAASSQVKSDVAVSPSFARRHFTARTSIAKAIQSRFGQKSE